MSGIQDIPVSKPFNVPTSDPNFEEKLLAHKKAEGNRLLLVQTLMEQQSQDQAARSSMQKASHDAMMGIINNMKA